MDKKYIYNIGDYIISDFVPQLNIMCGYNKIAQIIKIYNVNKINNKMYLIADVKMIDNDSTEPSVPIPLHRNVKETDNSILFLGKELGTIDLNKDEKNMFIRAFSFALKYYLKKDTFTISGDISQNVKNTLSSLADKTVRFMTYDNDSEILDIQYIQLFSYEYDKKQNMIIYTIPVMQYFDKLWPANNIIINKPLNKVISDIKKSNKENNKIQPKDFIY